MRTLIFPDVHHRWELVEKVIARERYDKIVFLGDYFDARGPLDTLTDLRATATWLKGSLEDNRRIHLWGNHDILYGLDSWLTYIPCYSEDKDKVIWEVLNRTDFSKLKFFTEEQGWLLSHAGLHPHFLPPMWKENDVTLKNVTEFLTAESSQFSHRLMLNQSHWFITIGSRRDHSAEGVNQGGLLWCDSREFQPIEGIPQIFGHTIQIDYPSIIDSKGNRINLSNEPKNDGRINTSEGTERSLCQRDGWNVALDCNSRFYGIIEDGCLSIKPSSQDGN